VSVVSDICQNQQCRNFQGDGQRPESSLILVRWQLLCQTVGWKGTTDRMVMEGTESKRGVAGNIIHHTEFIDGQ
jgi:hypothetical protein